MHPPLAYVDFSIKARSADPAGIERTLLALNAEFIGEDHQSDTYYQVPLGKLKLREGNIENLLTHYLREEVEGSMRTTVFLYEKNPSDIIKQRYTVSVPVIGKVIKSRRIFFIDNVKFHLDRFENGSSFVEIEAIDRDGTMGLDAIEDKDMINQSYIDLP